MKDTYLNCGQCVFHIFSIIYVCHLRVHRNSQKDQLPVGLIAQLVELCTDIAEVIGSVLVQTYIFFGLSFVTAMDLKHNMIVVMS